MNRDGNGQRGICAEHLYAHFFEEGHFGLNDLEIQIIDVTDKRLYEKGKLLGGKSNSFVPLGLNVKDL